MGIYLATGAALLCYWVLCWFIGSWLRLSGSDLWILRLALALLGLIAAGVFLWFHRRAQAASEGSAEDSLDLNSAGDVDVLVHEAANRLRNSKLGKGASLRTLPVVFVLGEPGSIKTSTIINSGLDPELIAGRAYQDNNVQATRTANIWYTRQAVFVDCGGEMLNQPGQWARLIRLTQPGRISSTVGKAEQAPRAVLLCYAAENFFAPGAGEATLAAAKKFNSRLQEVSRLLSVSFPVYVLFTKLDRIPFFAEYAQNLTKDEAGEVLGATLTVRPAQSAGVYAEEESRRLTKAFDELFYSLAEKRLDLIAREPRPEKQPGIYEFPRELRKARALLSEFLVNLARPSQLQVNPFLRGFYFSGVRAVLVDDIARAGIESSPVEEAPMDAGATRIFSSSPLRQQQAAVPARVGGSRKVPQWAFVSKLFHEVILKDRVAFSASRFSARANLLRRILLAAALGMVLIFCIGFVVSFFQNRSLESDVMSAARDIPAVQLKDKQLPAIDDLQRLERLRAAIASLAQYQREGAPWKLRWGLYVGDDIFPEARKLYFTRFRQLLFGQTQNNILDWMRSLPNHPGPNDSYEKTYNALKAHLITTTYNDKSTVEFLSPVLMSHWSAGREIDAGRSELARKQFDFYSSELAASNPYLTGPNDPGVVAQARSYLSEFGGIDRYYLPLISEASQKNPNRSFNEEFSGSAAVINSNYKVRGAFTRNGFQFMDEAIRQPQRYISGEEWVLGKQTASQLDAATLQQKLRDRYYDDFINEWRMVLSRSHVVGFGKESADERLGKLTGLSSPLLQLLWFISSNTNTTPAVTEPFLSVHTIEPPGPPNKLPDQYITPANKPYIDALAKLQGDLSLYLRDQSLATQALTSAGAARQSITQVMGTRIDQQFHTENAVRQLLEEPILMAERIVYTGPKDALNKAGAGFCARFEDIRHKYPFGTLSDPDLPLAKLNEIFAPGTGALWVFYNDPATKVSQYLTKDGQPIDSATVKISPAFAAFFRRAAGLSNAFYGDTNTEPKISYRMGQLKTNISGLTIKVGDQTLAENDALKSLTWSGKEDVQVSSKGAPYGAYSGPWAVFRFVSGARWTGLSSGVNQLHREIESNGQLSRLPDGRVMFYDYQLQTSGTNPFNPSSWADLRCVSQVAR